MAVPAPRTTQPVAHHPNPEVEAMRAIAADWTHMPNTISDLRPHRSDSAPVRSCPSPHTAGYRAARTPIAPTDNPERAKNRGKAPHAKASFRLFTTPAWLHADRAGSRMVVRTKTSRVDMPRGERESASAASRWAN